MTDSSKRIQDWHRIESASGTVLSPPIRTIHFRRELVQAMEGDCCSDLCQKQAQVVLNERPATLITHEGNRVRMPEELDTQHLEEGLSSLNLSTEQIRYLVNSRRRLALCFDCAVERMNDEK